MIKVFKQKTSSISRSTLRVLLITLATTLSFEAAALATLPAANPYGPQPIHPPNQPYKQAREVELKGHYQQSDQQQQQQETQGSDFFDRFFAQEQRDDSDAPPKPTQPEQKNPSLKWMWIFQ